MTLARRLLAVALASLSTVPLRADEFWRDWGDGKAEVSGYNLIQPRYGEKRTGRAVLIFVTEDHSESERVKIKGDPADHRDRFPVLKLNAIREFRTGVYDYKVMLSAFSRIDRAMEISKVSFTAQEWCGHAYHQLVARGSGLRETLHSYFGGEADQERRFAIPQGAVFEDALPILIRELRGTWVRPDTPVTFACAPSLMALRFGHKPFAWGRASVLKSGETERITTPLGTFIAHRWTVTTPLSGTIVYWVEAAGARRVLAWKSDGGESAQIVGSRRQSYWSLNKPGDEKHLADIFPPGAARK